MITKDTFCKTIEALKRKRDAENEIDGILSKYKDVYYDGMLPIDCTEGLIVSLLEEAFDLPISDDFGSTLSWWMYEQDFGETFEIGDIENLSLPEDDPYRKPDLGTPEKLYDYLLWEKKMGEEPAND